VFEYLTGKEKILLQSTELLEPTFELGLVRFLLGTISELRARNIAIQEVKDECDGGVSDEIANENQSHYLVHGIFNEWMKDKDNCYLIVSDSPNKLEIKVSRPLK